MPNPAITGEQTFLLLTTGACVALLVQQLARWLHHRRALRHAWAATWALGAAGWSVARFLGLRGDGFLGVPAAVGAALCLAVMAAGALGVVGNLRRHALSSWHVLGALGAGLALVVCWALVPGPWSPTQATRTGLWSTPVLIVDPGLIVGSLGLGLLFAVTVALLRLGLRQGLTTGTGALLGVGLLVWVGSLCNDLLFAMGLLTSMPLHAYGVAALAVILGVALVPAATAARGAAAAGDTVGTAPRQPTTAIVPPTAATPVEELATASYAALADGADTESTAATSSSQYRLRNRMLVEALAEAREASENRQRFLARASHELRTPLHGILGMTELALEGQLDPTRRRYLAAAHRSAEELLAMVEELLALARTESNQFELAAEPIGLQRFLDDTLDLLAQQAGDKGIELYDVVSASLPTTVIGDPQRLRQVLVNLLGNAIKFTERGHVALRVSEVPATLGRVGLRVEVEDTGPGIPESEQALVLEPFGQGAAGLGRGTGLGLAICVELLRRMGSELQLRSREGEGTTFSFELELDLEDPTDEITVIDPVLMKGTRVLVADDHPGSAASVKAELAAWRLRTAVVGSGEEALAELEQARADQQPYTILLADADMPGLDGWGLLDALASEGASEPRPAVILMLAPDAPPTRAAEALDRGAQAVVGKPLRTADLHQALLVAIGALKPQEPRPVGTVPATTGPRARVLVADDRPVNRDVARAFLESMGCEVMAVAEGLAAVDVALAERFDLVLMDIGMPGLRGDDATTRIRGLEESAGRRPVPIVALTAHADASDRERFVRAGMDAVLQKPLTRAALRDVLDRFVPPVVDAETPPPTDAAPPEEPTLEVEDPLETAVSGGAGYEEIQTLPPFDDDTGDAPRTDLDELPSGPLDPRLALASGLPLVLPPAGEGQERSDGLAGPVIFDPARLDDIADGSAALKRDLVEIFLGELPRYEDWLRDALVTGESEELERVGHALAGAAANLALIELAGVARKLCDAARAGDAEGAAWIVVDVLGAVERGRDTLLQVQADLAAGGTP